ncbi:MAG: DNA-directed RNA polymerase subunit A', partial [Nanoarchaeota archaeon]
VCAPYGADFDGDEMNVHIPQTEEARAEAEILMMVQTQLIAPKHGYNIIGCNMDSLTGNYLLTRKDIEFTKEDAVQMLFAAGIYRPERFEKFKKSVSGKEIFSSVLPDDFEFIGQSKNKQPIVIKKGHLVEGIIDKVTIGKDKGEIIRALCTQYGFDIGIDILGKIFRLGLQATTHLGFTSTIADTDLPADVEEKCKEAIYNAERRVGQLIEEYKDGKLEILPGLNAYETFEVKARETLDKARSRVGEIVAEMDAPENPTIIMAGCGSGGNILNLAMMASCVGQQTLRGKRLSNGYRNRTLALFSKGEMTPRAKGFIKHSYKEGLTPDEYFLHAITGRDSLTDTALRTPKSGYLYRRLSNAMQDIKVEYDRTVRDANENIIQFIYGEDGVDVSKSEGGKINVARIVKEIAGEK